MIRVDVGQSIANAERMLKGIPGGLQKAVRLSFNRALEEGRTEAIRAVTSEYTLKAKTVRPTFKFKKASTSRLDAELSSRGANLPLEEFSHRPTSDTTGAKRKQVRVAVKKGSPKPIGQGFIWKGQVRQRAGSDRLPIPHKYGIAVPVALNNDEVVDIVVEKIGESVEKRLDHETQRLLDGY